MKGNTTGNMIAVEIKLQPSCRHLFPNMSWHDDMTSHKQNESEEGTTGLTFLLNVAGSGVKVVTK